MMTPYQTKFSNRQKGITIIELMIALLLSLVLVGGMIQLFLSNSHSYRIQTNLARLQENARFITETITKELRMTNYAGCHSFHADNLAHINTITADDFAWETDATTSRLNTLRAYPSDSLPTALSTLAVLSGTDVIAVRRLSERTALLAGDFDGAVVGGGNSPDLTLDANWQGTSTAISFQADTPIVISDCSHTALSKITTVSGETITIGTDSNKTSEILRLQEGDAGIFESGSLVGKLQSTLFYVGSDEVLYRQVLAGDGQGVAEEMTGNVNVKLFQIWFGVDTDTDPDNTPNRFIRATDMTTADWSRVISARIILTLESGDNTSKVERRFSSTVNLRNQVKI